MSKPSFSLDAQLVAADSPVSLQQKHGSEGCQSSEHVQDTKNSAFWQSYVHDTLRTTAGTTARSPREAIAKAQAHLDAEEKAMKGAIRALRAHRNSISIISRLPMDVLLCIFAFVVNDDPPAMSALDRLREGPQRLGWIRVTQVCRSWRETALADSSLWSWIKGDLTLEWARAMLSRSKASPLKVDVASTSMRLDVMNEVLGPNNMNRISQLRLQDSTDDHRFFKKLAHPAPLLDSLFLQFPAGRDFAITPPYILSSLLHPRLQRLELFNHYRLSRDVQVLRNLVHLEIGDSVRYVTSPTVEQLVPIVQECSRLNRLTLKRFRPQDDTFEEAGIGKFLAHRRFSLPHLERLELLGHQCAVPLFLSQLDFPASTGVWIHLEHDNNRHSPSWQLIPLLLSWSNIAPGCIHFDSLALETGPDTWITLRMPATAIKECGTRPSLRITIRKTAIPLLGSPGFLQALHTHGYFKRIARLAVLARDKADVLSPYLEDLLTSPSMSELKRLYVTEPTDASIELFNALALPAGGWRRHGPLLMPSLEYLTLEGPKTSLENPPEFALSDSLKEALVAFLSARQSYGAPLIEFKMVNCGDTGEFMEQVKKFLVPHDVSSKNDKGKHVRKLSKLGTTFVSRHIQKLR
ncbi:hypothetical protein EVG20_g11405 [Dentipellis fragilis]|uniref:F-box domain-containing protein n=1 Tax=Dentipellis fragilis TaxID=205917 RepID=A0A4Y9XMR1_9AGAM|nr:hypothetical protein EVG20_g11405 [Dentipellis fragilis]